MNTNRKHPQSSKEEVSSRAGGITRDISDADHDRNSTATQVGGRSSSITDDAVLQQLTAQTNAQMKMHQEEQRYRKQLLDLLQEFTTMYVYNNRIPTNILNKGDMSFEHFDGLSHHAATANSSSRPGVGVYSYQSGNGVSDDNFDNDSYYDGGDVGCDGSNDAVFNSLNAADDLAQSTPFQTSARNAGLAAPSGISGDAFSGSNDIGVTPASFLVDLSTNQPEAAPGISLQTNFSELAARDPFNDGMAWATALARLLTGRNAFFWNNGGSFVLLRDDGRPKDQWTWFQETSAKCAVTKTTQQFLCRARCLGVMRCPDHNEYTKSVKTSRNKRRQEELILEAQSKFTCSKPGCGRTMQHVSCAVKMSIRSLPLQAAAGAEQPTLLVVFSNQHQHLPPRPQKFAPAERQLVRQVIQEGMSNGVKSSSKQVLSASIHQNSLFYNSVYIVIIFITSNYII